MSGECKSGLLTYDFLVRRSSRVAYTFTEIQVREISSVLNPAP